MMAQRASRNNHIALCCSVALLVTGFVTTVDAFSPLQTAARASASSLLHVSPTMSRPLSASRHDESSPSSSHIEPMIASPASSSSLQSSSASKRTMPSSSSSSITALEWMTKHSRSLAVAATAITATTVLMTPSVALAVDSTITAFAYQTNSWFTSIAETGFYQAFTLVFLSEIGDKTFFIAGLLAMKTSKLLSFVGSMAALAVMTVLSVVIGQVFHAVPSGFGEGLPLDDIAAALAFAFFGVKTLLEALQMDENASIMDEELAEAQETVDSSETIQKISWVGRIVSIFTLVFAAEFGDRSFLSTIALSAAQNPVSVAGGAIAAHGVATGIAVSGGSFVAKYISEKVIGIIGGSLFIVFAVTTALGIF